ncbi:hypothetical protein RJ639_037939 [Escallonia herrerae]|uniref:Pectinesterase inhibitor domain-containing protein n=1 Tax=Escallonia herrerae TaxID=1293975 RepID=A0AA88WLB7_9ASTE|nr:hypothetical protein RJ639_037939 [Escallonia herrerae]
MGFPYSSSSLMISLLHVLLFIDHSFARTNTDTLGVSLVPEVCQRTPNPDFCVSALHSDPRTIDINDLGALLEVSLDLASSNATGTSNKIRSLVLKTRDPALKARLEVCVNEYDGALENIEETNEFLKSGDYDSINLAALGAGNHADSCEGAFKQSPVYQSPLSTDNLNLKLLSDIAAAIAKMLEA